MQPNPDAVAGLTEAPQAVADQLVEALAGALDADARVADEAVRRLKSAPVKRLKSEAEPVADRFAAITKEAELAQRQAKAQRTELRSVRSDLAGDLAQLLAEQS
ncbi:MAG: hypothetical protein QOG80_2852 [Pseudonocardiales bacterium]|nr:hypothetical protein [Pseudonocardiales bacterium]